MSRKKYKLVISDFHIGSGRLGPDGGINRLESFILDSRFAGFLEYYSKRDFGRSEVELIINGDFLNTLQVDYREEYTTNISEEVALQKVSKIFEGHPELFQALADFAHTPNHSITYVFGNHDPAVMWPAVRDDIEKRLDCEINWPGFRYRFDGVWVEHGNQFTPANRFNPNKLFVEYKNGDKVLNLPWGCIWVIDYLNVIKKERSYIDRVQPFGRYLGLGVLLDPLFTFRALARLAAFFARERLAASKWKDKDELRRTWEILRTLAIVPDLEPHARKIIGRPDYHTAIFGHNHQAAYRRYGGERLYVNTGTWNDIIHLDIQNLGRARRLTYAFIDYPDNGDHPRTRLKIWKGTHQTEEDVIF